MRILLVDPPGRNKGLNTGLGYLSAILKRSHEIRILDLNNVVMGRCGDPNPIMPNYVMENRIKKAIEAFNPHLFGISVKTFTAVIAKNIFHLAKEIRQDMITVVGGPHITLDGEKFIVDNKIDYGIKGEGEYRFDDLCKTIQEGKGWENIEGLYFWANNNLYHNPDYQNIKHLDRLPFPDYNNFSSVIQNNYTVKEYPLLSSRGCPYNCAYCSMPAIMGRKWRSHSPDRVIEELEHARAIYKSKNFTIVDDNFTLDLRRVDKICDLLISQKMNFPWNSQNGIRADRLSEDIALKMRKAGCQFVWIGIESADEDVFNRINKGEKLENIKQGINHLRKAGIRVGGFFIIGLPYSTMEADLKSIDFVREQGIEGWWFNFVPYPHTQFFDWVQANGRILRPIDGVLQFGSTSIEPVFDTPEYPKSKRIQAYNEIHIKLKYLDRLVDSSLRQYEKWPKVFKIVAPYGATAILSFLLFVLKYNLRFLKEKIPLHLSF